MYSMWFSCGKSCWVLVGNEGLYNMFPYSLLSPWGGNPASPGKGNLSHGVTGASARLQVNMDPPKVTGKTTVFTKWAAM